MDNQLFIFRTSVSKKTDLKRIGNVLNKCSQISHWNVDFEDWEKILRIECNGLTARNIVRMLRIIDIYAEELK
ncbi:hypothetical protein [Bacteroides salyersiae]|uniref:hypothetical protein n=1 Tax=Bacteroides salyersiae TaxID=291644 RepID=UPI001C8C7AB7|nr:hypothetical protein [Bacteroides salyersiae]